MTFLRPIFSILLLILTFSFSDSQDVMLSFDGGDLNYSSTADIYGFQFDHDGCVTGAAGGEAANNGFITSASGSVVLGFSFSGTFVPAGEGTLTELSGDVSQDCLSNLVFSGQGGSTLTAGWSEAGGDDGGGNSTVTSLDPKKEKIQEIKIKVSPVGKNQIKTIKPTDSKKQ